jgi:hypothetical protein
MFSKLLRKKNVIILHLLNNYFFFYSIHAFRLKTEKFSIYTGWIYYNKCSYLWQNVDDSWLDYKKKKTKLFYKDYIFFSLLYTKTGELDLIHSQSGYLLHFIFFKKKKLRTVDLAPAQNLTGFADGCVRARKVTIETGIRIY